MDQTDEPSEVGSEPQAPVDAGGVADAENTRLDLNSAGVSELSRLPGITAALAERIVEYRHKHGAFKEPAEVTQVRGMPRTLYLGIADLITVRPVDATPPPGPAAGVEPQSVSTTVEAPAAADGTPAQAVAPPRRELPPLDFAEIEPAPRGPGWLGIVAVAIASALLGACLALVILAIVNGTLQFGRAAALRRTTSAVQDLSSTVDRVAADVGQVQGRLDRGQADLEAMGQELRAARDQLQTLDENVTAMQAELTGLRTDLGSMGESMTGLEHRALAVETQLAGMAQQVRIMRADVERFDAFLAGLRALLDQAQPPNREPLGPAGTPLSPLPTPSPVSTARPQPTATPGP